jgi:hypothetical protein
MSVHQSHSMLHVVLATAAISLMTLEPFFCWVINCPAIPRVLTCI